MLSCGAWTSATPRALTTGGSTIGCSVPVIIIIITITIVIIIVAIIVVVVTIIVVVIIAMLSSLSSSSIINQTMQCTLHLILILMYSANTHCIVRSGY